MLSGLIIDPNEADQETTPSKKSKAAIRDQTHITNRTSPVEHRRLPAHTSMGRGRYTEASSPRQPFPGNFLSSTGLWRRSGSNRQPSACKADALPVELRPRFRKDEGGRMKDERFRLHLSAFIFRSSGGTWIRTKDLSFIRAAL